MREHTLISIQNICQSYGIEDRFLFELMEYGLIEIEKGEYVRHETLPKVEKIISFNRNMNINLEGIEVILRLLDKMEKMDRDLRRLRNRLNLYE